MNTRTTAPSAVCIRRYRHGDGPAINRGFERVFGKTRDLAEWEWKFPADDREKTILLAEEDGEILAHFAAVPVSLQVDGRRIRGGQVVDVYSVRRPGLFLRLVARFYHELCGAGRLELIYGFPGERHFRLGVRKLRYSEPVAVKFWSRSVEPADGEVRRLGRGLRERWRAWKSTVGLGETLEPTEADRLWERISSRLPVAAVRDRKWVERRFGSRPGVEYLYRVVRRRGEPAALAVLRVDDSVLYWAELLWDGEERQTLRDLDAEVERVARRSGARECRLWLAGDPEAEAVFEERGWRPGAEPQGLHLGAVSFLPELDPLAVCRRFYLTMGDADLV
jgi:hypothetical protein